MPLNISREKIISNYNVLMDSYNSKEDQLAWLAIDEFVSVAMHSVGRTSSGHLAIWGVGTADNGTQTLLGFHFKNDTECHYIMVEADGAYEETVFPFAPNTNAGAVYTIAKTVETTQGMNKEDLLAFTEAMLASAVAEMN